MSTFRPLLQAALACVLFLTACADTGPVSIRIFGQNPATRTYGEFDAPLATVTDAVTMRGDTVQFVGNATLVADVVAGATDPKGNRTLRAEGGAPPSCSFYEKDGVLHAEDYDSLNMASSYWALEQSRNAFLDLGMQPQELNALRAFYHPRIQLATKVVPTFWYLTDNAAYAPPFDGFLIVPHIALQGIPFTANLGVMAHEYSHKVYNRLVEKGSPVQAWLKHDWSPSAQKQVRGVDEGLADIFGFWVSQDPNYFAASVSPAEYPGLDRDLSVERIMPADYAQMLLDVSEEGSGTGYDPHELGAYVASALWQIGEDLQDHRRIAVEVLQVERELGEAIAQTPTYDFSTLEVLSRLASKFTASERDQVCAIFKKRFEALIAADTAHPLEACP